MNRTVELLNDLRHSREGSLCIALEAVNDIANHALLDLLDLSSSPGEAQVRYKSHVHQQLFLIRLLDFAKEGGDQALTGTPGSCLDVLLAACVTRAFDSEGVYLCVLCG